MCTKDRFDYHWNTSYSNKLSPAPALSSLYQPNKSYLYIFHMRVLEFLDTSFIHLKSIFKVIFFKKKNIISRWSEASLSRNAWEKMYKEDLCFVWTLNQLFLVSIYIRMFSSSSFSLLLLLKSNHLCSNNPSLVMEPNRYCRWKDCC